MAEEMTTRQVLDALRARHGSAGGTGEWVCIEEALSGFATMGGGIDLLAIGVWRTAKAPGLTGAGKGPAINPIVAYEVKVSRSDFRRELYGVQPKVVQEDAPWRTWRRGRERPGWPHKAAGALEVSHFFAFVVPAGLLKPEELERREPWPEDTKGRPLWVPAEAGLLEVTASGCRVTHPTPRRELGKELGRHATAELIRHAVDPNGARQARANAIYWERRYQEAAKALRELRSPVEA